MEHKSLVVVGAGPYGLAIAAYALDRGIDTLVFGRPMAFWTERMPAGMFLRSGTDWHFDAAGVHTFAAYVEEVGLRRGELDPIPIGVLLGYAAWFEEMTKLRIRSEMVTRLVSADGRWRVALENGEEMEADAVVAAPGPGAFPQVPEWAERVPDDIASHTSDLVAFDGLGGARVVIVGGRQSAYEWAALIAEHGAGRVDVVHRHPEPRFARVSWDFVEPYMAATVNERGWWRSLRGDDQEAIAREFWEAGRLTLEWWLAPRLEAGRVDRWPGRAVVSVDTEGSGSCVLTLSDGARLGADRVVFATGYRADFSNVRYLSPVPPGLEVRDGYPVLDEAFQTTLPGLYVPGFPSTRDFGPFFGFTRGCPVAAKLIVEDLLRRP